MDNMPVVIIFDPNIIVKGRVKSILVNQEVKIYEAQSRKELLRILAQNNYNVNLIITEIELDTKEDFDGIGLIKLVKSKKSSIPVVVLSSNSKKDVITRCFFAGASDYVLKPFEDEYLKEKLLKYIDIENLTELTVLQFNLKNFLESEIYKAKKGKYDFSLVAIQFDSTTENKGENAHYEFYNYSEKIYKEMKSLFWKSDLYIQHGYQSHLGFFPFCSQAHTKTIIEKTADGFKNFKSKEPSISDYSISFASSTFPADGDTPMELLNNLSVKNKKA